MVSIELRKARKTGFMLIVRFRPLRNNTLLGLRSDLQKLKDAISKPAEDTVTRPWQKTIDFVDGLKGKLPGEELAYPGASEA